MVKIGDTVRFLNAVGGGRVVRIDDRMAYVEEDDGFETPVLLRECVVVTPAPKLVNSDPSKAEKYDLPVPQQAPAKPVLPVVETPDGNTVNAVLAFEPQNIKALSNSDFDAYFVNDSNYWLYVAVAARSSVDTEWTHLYDGLVEPNIQEFVAEIQRSDLPALDRLLVQVQVFKRGRTYEAKRPASVEIKVDATKFFKLHCFRPNKYFDSPVIAYDIVRADSAAMQYEPDSAEIARGMREKQRAVKADRKPLSRSSKPASEPVVVDLHASELLDTTAGLSPADILNVQVEAFRKAMDAHLRHPGAKLVFIHGKGEGVLRQALLKELNHRYKGHDVQDASFAEYGYGATQVTIRGDQHSKSRL